MSDDERPTLEGSRTGGPSASTSRFDVATRRRLLATVGASAGIAVAGCLGDDGASAPDYGDRESVDEDAAGRTAEEMAAAEGLAELEIRESVTHLESVSVADHEFVLEDDYLGSTVQGTVENAGSDRLDLVEVRTRVYDEEGALLGRYIDRTGDLAGEAEWAFTVVVLEAPAEIDAYDVAALGTPT